MAYVKNYTEKFKIGQEVILTKKVDSVGGYFEKGTVVTITDIDKLRGYAFKDSQGNLIIECGWDCCCEPF